MSVGSNRRGFLKAAGAGDFLVPFSSDAVFAANRKRARAAPLRVRGYVDIEGDGSAEQLRNSFVTVASQANDVVRSARGR